MGACGSKHQLRMVLEMVRTRVSYAPGIFGRTICSTLGGRTGPGCSRCRRRSRLDTSARRLLRAGALLIFPLRRPLAVRVRHSIQTLGGARRSSRDLALASRVDGDTRFSWRCRTLRETCVVCRICSVCLRSKRNKFVCAVKEITASSNTSTKRSRRTSHATAPLFGSVGLLRPRSN